VHRAALYEGLVVRRDRGIETTADLKGRKVGVVPGSTSVYLLHLARLEAGLAAGDLTEVPMKPEDGPDLIASGAVDAISIWPPHVQNAVAKLPEGVGKVIYVPAYTQMSMLVTTPENLLNKREALQRFVRALVRAEEFILEQDAEARELVTRPLANQPLPVAPRQPDAHRADQRTDLASGTADPPGAGARDGAAAGAGVARRRAAPGGYPKNPILRSYS
jgi:NitT/TauT family transport system substrate-binding protein